MSEQQTQQQDITINIADIDLAARIIGAAIERGAIKAAESEEVGRIWKKLTSFVQLATKANEEQQPETNTGE